MKNFFKHTWEIIRYPLMYLGIQIVVSVVYYIALGVSIGVKIGVEKSLTGEDFRVDELENSIYDLVFSQMLIPTVISMIAAGFILFVILRKEWFREKFWGFQKVKILPLSVCLIGGVAMNILTICVLSLLPIYQQPSALDEMLGNNLIFEFIVIALIGPVLEEVIFRGIVLKRLNKLINRNAAVILSAFIFGLVHMNLIQGTYTFLLGIIIGYVYLWFGSVWYAIAIHTAYNGINIILSGISGEIPVDFTYFFVAAIVIFIISLASLHVLKSKNRKLNRWEY